MTNSVNKVISDLLHGAHTLINSHLLDNTKPPTTPMAHKATIRCIDILATDVRKGFIVGPFMSPPLAGFRANSLHAMEHNGFQPTLDLSSPSSSSFNDSIKDSCVPRIPLPTPREIADDLFYWGKDAYLSLLCFHDAFKLIPVHPRFHLPRKILHTNPASSL